MKFALGDAGVPISLLGHLGAQQPNCGKERKALWDMKGAHYAYQDGGEERRSIPRGIKVEDTTCASVRACC